ncbi:MAG: CerR family C-terminal domain-containing protein [Pseudobdellovibrionaceae bacterium]
MKRCPKKTLKDAKSRLLEAAVKIFAHHGFEGASTRMLVKEAGVNISAIPYYFSGKEGLYEAVLRHIMAVVHEDRGEAIAAMRAALEKGDVTQETAHALLHEFVGGFIGFLLGEKATPYMAQIIMREQMQPSPAFDLIYEELMRPVHMMFTRLVAILIGEKPESEEAILCTHMIFGQLVVFKTHKELLLRRTGWTTYGPEQIKTISELVRTNMDALIAAHAKEKRT